MTITFTVCVCVTVVPENIIVRRLQTRFPIYYTMKVTIYVIFLFRFVAYISEWNLATKTHSVGRQFFIISNRLCPAIFGPSILDSMVSMLIHFIWFIFVCGRDAEIASRWSQLIAPNDPEQRDSSGSNAHSIPSDHDVDHPAHASHRYHLPGRRWCVHWHATGWFVSCGQVACSIR